MLVPGWPKEWLGRSGAYKLAGLLLPTRAGAELVQNGGTARRGADEDMGDVRIPTIAPAAALPARRLATRAPADLLRVFASDR